MNSLYSISDVRKYVDHVRKSGRRLGFVPTMGAIHAGHRSLMRAAKAECDVVIVSIFVNPTQFAPGEDYEKYPRPIEADLAACREENVDAVFMPSPEEMYPLDSVTTVQVARLTEGLCGAHRPGHFDGVTTVVAKLFNIVQPDAAYFGQKDAQQAVVIRRMVRDLLWPIEIVVSPTIRESDGLAMSSRNIYLSSHERQQALSLSRALFHARDQVARGKREAAVLIDEMTGMITEAGAGPIDYIEIVDAHDLQPMAVIEHPALIALAVHVGPGRLIDNIIVDPNESGGPVEKRR